MLKLNDGLGCFAAHVLNRVLVSQPIGTLSGSEPSALHHLDAARP